MDCVSVGCGLASFFVDMVVAQRCCRWLRVGLGSSLLGGTPRGLAWSGQVREGVVWSAQVCGEVVWSAQVRGELEWSPLVRGQCVW